jgi:hypothetical protein
LFVSRKHGESGFFSRAMPLTIHMCQEASSTYRLVTSFRTNWNFFNLPSLSLTNRAISESTFPVLKTHALRAFLRTNTEPKVSSFIRLNKIVFSMFLRLTQISFGSYIASHILSVYSSYAVCFYFSTSLIKFVSFIASFVLRLQFVFEFVILETQSNYTTLSGPDTYYLLRIVTTQVARLHRVVTIS